LGDEKLSIFNKILTEMHEGMILHTPVKRKLFEIKSIEADVLVFYVGAKTLIPIPRAIWDDIPKFLGGQGWVRIGAKYDVASKGTLQEFIDNHPSRGTQHSSDANYVASVLEYLKIAEVDHRTPSEIRLIADL
jgi:hypothetical protein